MAKDQALFKASAGARSDRGTILALAPWELLRVSFVERTGQK